MTNFPTLTMFANTNQHVEIDANPADERYKTPSEVIVSIPTYGWNGGRDGETSVYLPLAHAREFAQMILDTANRVEGLA